MTERLYNRPLARRLASIGVCACALGLLPINAAAQSQDDLDRRSDQTGSRYEERYNTGDDEYIDEYSDDMHSSRYRSTFDQDDTYQDRSSIRGQDDWQSDRQFDSQYGDEYTERNDQFGRQSGRSVSQYEDTYWDEDNRGFDQNRRSGRFQSGSGDWMSDSMNRDDSFTRITRRGWTDSPTDGSDADWAFIGYDINNDGHFDVYEYIWVADLDQVRRRDLRSGQAQMRRTGQRSGRDFRVQGELVDLRLINLDNMDEPHVVGRIETSRGIVKADLGPRSKIDELNLRRGDTITVFGRQGQINDRRMLRASRIQSNNQHITIRRDRSQSQQKLEGTIVGIQRMMINQTGREHAIARIRTNSGNIVQVDLGSAKAAQSLDLNQGDQIAVLGNRGRIDDRVALFAEQLRLSNGEVLTLSRAPGTVSPFRQTRFTTQQNDEQWNSNNDRSQFNDRSQSNDRSPYNDRSQYND